MATTNGPSTNKLLWPLSGAEYPDRAKEGKLHRSQTGRPPLQPPRVASSEPPPPAPQAVASRRWFGSLLRRIETSRGDAEHQARSVDSHPGQNANRF